MSQNWVFLWLSHQVDMIPWPLKWRKNSFHSGVVNWLFLSVWIWVHLCLRPWLRQFPKPCLEHLDWEVFLPRSLPAPRLNTQLRRIRKPGSCIREQNRRKQLIKKSQFLSNLKLLSISLQQILPFFVFSTVYKMIRGRLSNTGIIERHSRQVFAIRRDKLNCLQNAGVSYRYRPRRHIRFYSMGQGFHSGACMFLWCDLYLKLATIHSEV